MSFQNLRTALNSGLGEKTGFVFYFFLALVLSLPFVCMPLVNPDLFWHLSAGKFIFGNLAVPRADFLSWTAQGAEWIDFEWLTQVLYYFVHSEYGAGGLYALKLLLVLLSLSAAGALLSLFLKNPRHLLWCLPLAAASMLSSSDLRPENFSAGFFSLVFYLLEKKKTSPSAGAGTLFFFFFAFALWANLHGGFLYGLLLMCIYTAGAFLNENTPYIYGETRKLSFSKSAPLAAWLAAAFAGTFLNPYGCKVYAVIADHYRLAPLIQDYITEWRAFDITYEYIRPFAALMILSITFFLADFLKNRRTDFTRFFLILSFSFLCLSHMRNSMYGTVVFSAILLSSLPERAKSPGAALPAVALVLLLLGLHFYNSVFQYYGRFDYAKFEKNSPELSDFLKKNRDEIGGLKMYNMWAWGGWLGWELYPDYKVFVDGRYIFHPMLEETVKARAYLDFWKTLEKKYGIELVVMEPTQTRLAVKHGLKGGGSFMAQRPFYLFLLPKKEWAVVYFDARIFAAVKRDRVDKNWLKENEYVYLRPNDLENLEVPLLEGELSPAAVEREVSRYLRSHSWDSPAGLNFYISDWHSRMTEKLADKKK
ncbi:MAG: hypothetical protein COT17_02400 [Elusimicrobia bacterium CG08_land_8_20_14_0_20_51_18]|nr:MAG: hypothetical protein COT17_02400 [Elusimicrobia bacterium CG08_land_8_20_14_0_20_51_18]